MGTTGNAPSFCLNLVLTAVNTVPLGATHCYVVSNSTVAALASHRLGGDALYAEVISASGDACYVKASHIAANDQTVLGCYMHQLCETPGDLEQRLVSQFE